MVFSTAGGRACSWLSWQAQHCMTWWPPPICTLKQQRACKIPVFQQHTSGLFTRCLIENYWTRIKPFTRWNTFGLFHCGSCSLQVQICFGSAKVWFAWFSQTFQTFLSWRRHILPLHAFHLKSVQDTSRQPCGCYSECLPAKTSSCLREYHHQVFFFQSSTLITKCFFPLLLIGVAVWVLKFLIPAIFNV